MNILTLNTSIFGAQGKSHQLSEHAITSLLKRYPRASVLRRDLNAPTDHLSLSEFSANTTQASERTPKQAELAQLSDNLIAELQAADILVLGLPMYNFGIPSTLKVWFDRVIRAGVTFGYTSQGPKGLLEPKRVLVASARGGSYAGSGLDTQTPLLNILFGFMGLTDVSYVYAEGLSQAEQSVDQIMDSAKTQIDQWVTN